MRKKDHEKLVMLLLPLYKSHYRRKLLTANIKNKAERKFTQNPKRTYKKLIHISQSALITQISSRDKKKAISLLDSRASNRKF